MAQVYVKVWPRSGAIVPDEFTGVPIEPGASVPRTRLTERRLARGELLEKPQGEGGDKREGGTHAERFADAPVDEEGGK